MYIPGLSGWRGGCSWNLGMATRTKKRQSRAQNLFDAVSYAASCLKEAGEPLHGLGPSAQYAAVFDRYAQALRELLSHECELHVADWRWDGYAGNFHFFWEFGAQLAQPGATYAHDTRFVEVRCPAQFDPQQPLAEELERLRVEAAHYAEMRGVMLRWARDARALSLASSTTEAAS